MAENNTSRTTSKVSLIVALATLIVGGIIGYEIGHSMNSSNNSSSSSSQSVSAVNGKAATLRANLVSLGTAHMILTDEAVDQSLDGSPSATATTNNLVYNGTQISQAIGSVYGKTAQSQFQKIWNIHLTDFVKYAVADKQGNKTAAQAALTDINNSYTIPISKLLSSANPNLPYNTVYSEFRDHVDMTAQMINDHVTGNYTAETTVLNQAITHIDGLMSTLAGAIVKQYPTKF